MSLLHIEDMVPGPSFLDHVVIKMAAAVTPKNFLVLDQLWSNVIMNEISNEMDLSTRQVSTVLLFSVAEMQTHFLNMQHQ